MARAGIVKAPGVAKAPLEGSGSQFRKRRYEAKRLDSGATIGHDKVSMDTTEIDHKQEADVNVATPQTEPAQREVSMDTTERDHKQEADVNVAKPQIEPAQREVKPQMGEVNAISLTPVKGKENRAHGDKMVAMVVSSEGRRWRVTGGSVKGGIIPRKGQELQSAKLSSLLATGSEVEEIELIDSRLHYRLISGEGPEFGWVTAFTSYGAALLELAARWLSEEQVIVRTAARPSVVQTMLALEILDGPHKRYR
eukprot:CAMPEP_0180731408 /NCGR_PEP_ID=MMETSP1038_2-20121128/21126_1 /TAXON_ID=632150 /ORGANISM="Azadinium spinosum, Strain 3D9" /LENGTH=252 /DNA_ID=CAMNT_0022764211 /DNA_START=49 /DNA_END=805 /DNA_ORIENTATION=-